MTGFVWLVGAGPGDPDLLTRKAARVLSGADLVLYDALVQPGMLDLAPHAQRFLVGKRGRRQSVRQETIHRLMIRAARAGKRVVRLKCGDPFVLGRGGEEALALSAAGIPFDVVPGISAAIAAPALMGIPVTHRGLSSSFVVVSGHAETAYAPVLDALVPNTCTLVVLMGLGNRAELAHRLVARGWRAETPAALILGAATPQNHVWLGALADLGKAVIPATHADVPGTIVVGDVVSLATRWSRAADASDTATAAAGSSRRTS